MNRLEGPTLKLDRAGEHLAALDTEISTFMAGNPYEVTTDANRQTGQKQFHLRIKDDFPRRAGLIAGDVIHNIRQALDQLAWQLCTTTYGYGSSRCSSRS